MAKKVINAYTQLDLTLPENKSKLNDLKNGELIVQSSKPDELKIWGKTADGSVASVPTTEDINSLVDEKVNKLDLDEYVKKSNLNTINGNNLYSENGEIIDIEIIGGNGTVDEEQLKEYAKKEDVQVVAESLDVFKTETEDSLNKKIDKSSVYTKNETDTLILSKADVGYSYSKTEINDLFNRKANTIDVYTKEEVNDLVSSLPNFSIEVVDVLPTESISETTMYLLPLGDASEDGSLYTLNIYSNGEWKELGKQTLNLNNYDTKEEVETKIKDAVTEQALNHYTKEETDSKLSDVLRVGTGVTTGDFNSYKETIYTKEEVNELIENIEISGGTVNDEDLKDYVKKDSLKTINGKSLILNGEEGEESNILIEGDVDVETLKDTFIEKSVYTEDINNIETEIEKKVNQTVYDARVKTVDNVLEQKADTTYVTKYVQASLSNLESYGMVVIPETVYENLIKNGQVYWNDVLLTYNENNIYFLYDETEDQEELPEIPSEPDFSLSEVTLTTDYSPSEPIVVEKTMKLDLGGKTLTGPTFPTAYDNDGNVTETDSYGLWVKEGGDIIIEGEGTIESQDATYSMAVWANGGKVTIMNGTFKNAGDGCDLIYASAGGQVEIYGGEFIATEYKGTEPGTTNPHSALNVKNGDRGVSDIKVYGGRFYGFDPANNLSEPNPSEEWLASHPNGFVAEGYKSIQNGEWFEVVPE